jgi:hypothetical protein
MPKVNKNSVGYSRGHRDSHCGKAFDGDRGYCRHYQPHSENEGSCTKVEGHIRAIDWCKLWSKARAG